MPVGEIFEIDSKIVLPMGSQKIKFKNSSQLLEAAYHPEKADLYILFINGGLYKYNPVKNELFLSLKNSPSPGGIFHKKIKKGDGITFKKI